MDEDSCFAWNGLRVLGVPRRGEFEVRNCSPPGRGEDTFSWIFARLASAANGAEDAGEL